MCLDDAEEHLQGLGSGNYQNSANFFTNNFKSKIIQKQIKKQKKINGRNLCPTR